MKYFSLIAIMIPKNESATKGNSHLRGLHRQSEESLLSAYGWENVELKHDFCEVEYLPENDRTRYTISPDSRKELLRRLLALNHSLHVEEIETEPRDKKKLGIQKRTLNKKDEIQENLFLE
jgi:hypothetical protein